MTTYVFPGQGSQIKGMGKDLFVEFPELVKQADEILGYSIVDLCVNDTHQQLNQTQYTQPALYIVNALLYLKKNRDEGITPNYLAGHSLGEYNALLAAQVYDFPTGLKLVQKRGELMSQAHGGSMAAIIGLNAEKIQQVLQEHQLTQIGIANYNSYTQQVISGPKSAIESAQTIFKTVNGARFFPMRVSGAFHSSYMTEASQKFAEYLKKFSFAPPKIPVLANVTAKPYQNNEIAHLLAQQIVQSVRWVETIEYLLAQGETDFQEIGPGNVLTGLIKRIVNRD